jgi:hypothetical protein
MVSANRLRTHRQQVKVPAEQEQAWHTPAAVFAKMRLKESGLHLWHSIVAE